MIVFSINELSLKDSHYRFNPHVCFFRLYYVHEKEETTLSSKKKCYFFRTDNLF